MNSEDLGTLVVCALRYCHRRRTYMPSEVTKIARRHWGELKRGDRITIARDTRELLTEADVIGDSCDIDTWQDFYDFICSYEEGEG